MLYPALVLAPLKIRAKAASFGVHDACAADPDSACTPCPSLIRMAYDSYYGHMTSISDVRRAIDSDLRAEARRG